MDKFTFLKTLEIPVLVVDKKSNIIQANETFESVFGRNIDGKKLQKFKNSFNIQCCMLYPDNLSKYNPINLAIESNGSSHLIATYQKSEDEFLTFMISSTKFEDNFIIKFIDLTNEYRLSELEYQYNITKNELDKIKTENAKSIETKDKAQNQAIKMAFLNRIFEALRSSIDINTTLDLSFKELSEIFGFSKVAFSYFDDNKNLFIIRNIYPQKYNDEISNTLDIEKNCIEKLKKNKFEILNIINPSASKNIAVKTECKILIPINQANELIGLISAVFPRQNLDKISNDMISAISAQFSSAIIQSKLFEELNSKNEQLQSAYEKLEQAQLQLVNSEKMASLGQLVAGVAHEINTPLASINSNNSIMEKIFQFDEIDSDMTDTVKSMIETDKEAIKRISNIVKSLKRFVRLDEAEHQTANINKEIDLTLELLKHETKNKIEIITKYTDNDEIKCYPNLLNQVFMNIIMNAIQSIDEKGEISITTQNENNNLIIKIKDTGSGMDESTKSKIFKSGFTTKKVGIGTGLGLMISNDIIKKHNGTIDFVSEKGKGTEFTISIPILK